MSTHSERAGKLYGGPGPAPTAVKPTKALARPRAKSAPVKSIYGNPYDTALSNYYTKREASLRGDVEGLEIARRERKQVETFARVRGLSAEHLHQALAVVHERDLYPLSKETIEKRRAQTIENLRLELGGSEKADAHLRRYVNLTTALAKEVPTLAARANATGAGEDPRIINALAHYGEAPTT